MSNGQDQGRKDDEQTRHGDKRASEARASEPFLLFLAISAPNGKKLRQQRRVSRGRRIYVQVVGASEQVVYV